MQRRTDPGAPAPPGQVSQGHDAHRAGAAARSRRVSGRTVRRIHAVGHGSRSYVPGPVALYTRHHTPAPRVPPPLADRSHRVPLGVPGPHHP
ncbi:hypothetical protein KCH_44340 [Kitasatospora cheerisanensis KCTC 2395]|uniref:Uncharacterized protein n=1 Tax=Kitasatospora cheerisanensis KCTC 2395 TaxID=1348663 RepID=A0A066Z0V6_9ACTN|nr:hypothetical protein KCH_44340 [Kitasatospora cheerisanensis KCTC 2395]